MQSVSMCLNVRGFGFVALVGFVVERHLFKWANCADTVLFVFVAVAAFGVGFLVVHVSQSIKEFNHPGVWVVHSNHHLKQEKRKNNIRIGSVYFTNNYFMVAQNGGISANCCAKSTVLSKIVRSANEIW